MDIFVLSANIYTTEKHSRALDVETCEGDVMGNYLLKDRVWF
jgi:hypothetical protein